MIGKDEVWDTLHEQDHLFGRRAKTVRDCENSWSIAAVSIVSDSTVAAFVPKGRGSNSPKVILLRADVAEKPRSLPSNFRPLAAHDAAGDEVRMRWTFVIIAVDGLADIHLESLHFSTLISAEKAS